MRHSCRAPDTRNREPVTPRRAPLLVHLAGAALLCAILAYWTLRVLEPVPPLVAAGLVVSGPQEPDPRLAARMFGDLGAAASAGLSVQVGGVAASGPRSSAVLSVDGKPARAYLIGQEVAPGTILVAVARDGVTIERSGVRSQFPVPPLATARSAPPAELEGGERPPGAVSAAVNPVSPPPRSRQVLANDPDRRPRMPVFAPVSYTHLTLPTNREV